mmetsp:Transcript_1055/g.1135  ORF Transcript_1055/g.1135 Transcript_1055/m.1135 type:complete len:389 (-) Transcript_1055:1422-2588(-)
MIHIQFNYEKNNDADEACRVRRIADSFNLSYTSVNNNHSLLDESLNELRDKAVIAVVHCYGPQKPTKSFDQVCNAITQIAKIKTIFVIAFVNGISNDPIFRLKCFEAGARMVCSSFESIATGVSKISKLCSLTDSVDGIARFTCPVCKTTNLSEDQLHEHFPLFHSSEPNLSGVCPICRKFCRSESGGLDVHIHNNHGPTFKREPLLHPSGLFSWVCVQNRSQFLLVNEPAGLSRGLPRYWLPAGRLDFGEGFIDAAIREVQEEAGMEIVVTGLLRFIGDKGIIFLAEPKNPSAILKEVPDFESVGAVWVSLDQLLSLEPDHFRDGDPRELYPKLASNALKPFSIDTPAFRELETTAKKQTQASNLNETKTWGLLRNTYPDSIFFDFY